MFVSTWDFKWFERTQKVLPEDGAISAETRSRQGDN